MTGSQFADYIRKQTKTNSTTLTDAELVLYANLEKDEIAKRVTKADEDYFGIIMYRNLVASQRNYAFDPLQLNHMKYLEAKVDGTNWEKPEEVDLSSLGITTDEATIISTFAGRTKPGFEIFGGELILFSKTAIIDVTDGLKLYTIVYPKDITSSTLADTSADLSEPPTNIDFGVPRQFHGIWADMVVVKYKTSQEKPIPLTQNEQLAEKRLNEAVDDIKGGNTDRSSISTVPTDDGQDY